VALAERETVSAKEEGDLREREREWQIVFGNRRFSLLKL
jgi:hypothetical protein